MDVKALVLVQAVDLHILCKPVDRWALGDRRTSAANNVWICLSVCSRHKNKYILIKDFDYISSLLFIITSVCGTVIFWVCMCVCVRVCMYLLYIDQWCSIIERQLVPMQWPMSQAPPPLTHPPVQRQYWPPGLIVRVGCMCECAYKCVCP